MTGGGGEEGESMSKVCDTAQPLSYHEAYLEMKASTWVNYKTIIGK